MSYVISRMLLILMIVEVIYFVLSTTLVQLYAEEFWMILFVSTPLVAFASLIALTYAVFVPGNVKKAAKSGIQMSLVTFLLASIVFAFMIGLMV